MIQISLFFFLLFSPFVAAEEEIELPPIVKTGTPGDVLLEDTIVPAVEGATPLNSGTGSIQNSLQNQLSLPITDYGRAGNMAQVRGLGPFAEEVDVQAFGISLNPPQGGGFDLSVFPQFLWSGYRYQSGPALNSLNQSAATGTLSLTPWTAKALQERGWGGRAIEFYSSLGTNQLSAAAKDGENVAAVAGYSSGKVQGPSASVSGRWERKNYFGSVHLLATDLDAESTGPVTEPAPKARTQGTRVIPVLQNDFRLSRNSFLKTSLFYDWSYMGYEDPDFKYVSKTYSQQSGFENVYLLDQWKFGLSAREVRFYSDLFQAPLQRIGNIQISRVIDTDYLFFEPTFQGVWVTGYGLLPQGSLGARKEWKGQAVFSRVSFSRRIPSLLDRFSTYSGFVGNPNLQMEMDWTGILGWEMKTAWFVTSLQGYVQRKEDARVLVGKTVKNLNGASIVALTGTAKVRFSKFCDVFNTATLSDSHLAEIQVAYPYVPVISEVIGVSVHSADLKDWDWSTTGRANSTRVFDISNGNRLPGYGVLDTAFKKKLTQAIGVTGRVENLFDRPVEIVQGYPLGRSFSLLLTGEI